MKSEPKNILVIDQTIREGMQHRGMLFSRQERERILEFQDKLGVDISQVAYPSAHSSERHLLRELHRFCCDSRLGIRLAGLCRTLIEDVKLLVESGISDFHMHSGINEDLRSRLGEDKILENLASAIDYIRENVPTPSIKLSLLDVGRTDRDSLASFAKFAMDKLRVGVLSLPDTSGIMNPVAYSEIVRNVCSLTTGTNMLIGAHCHNDLGMATANTIAGVLAGARVIEVSALGIGERNGIGDLFVVGKVLREEGYSLRLKTEQLEDFEAYYRYVNDLYVNKLGESRLDFNTPYFGDATISHVAGTHGIAQYGIFERRPKEKYFFNVLTGKSIVLRFAKQMGLELDEASAARITNVIKDASHDLGRSLSNEEVLRIIDEN